jgi:hypothetical protein
MKQKIKPSIATENVSQSWPLLRHIAYAIHTGAFGFGFHFMQTILTWLLPIAVVARSKARTLFARSNTEIVGSNPTEGMDICVCCVRLFCLHSLR